MMISMRKCADNADLIGEMRRVTATIIVEVPSAFRYPNERRNR